MRVHELTDGNFLVLVPLDKGRTLDLILDEKTLRDNFIVDAMPDESVFTLEPRPLADYLERTATDSQELHTL